MATQIKTAELIAKLDLFKAESVNASMGKAFGLYGLKGRDYQAGDRIFELALEFIDVNSYSLRMEVFTLNGDFIKSEYLNLTTAKANKVKDWLKSTYTWIW